MTLFPEQWQSKFREGCRVMFKGMLCKLSDLEGLASHRGAQSYKDAAVANIGVVRSQLGVQRGAAPKKAKVSLVSSRVSVGIWETTVVVPVSNAMLGWQWVTSAIAKHLS